MTMYTVMEDKVLRVQNRNYDSGLSVGSCTLRYILLFFCYDFSPVTINLVDTDRRKNIIKCGTLQGYYSVACGLQLFFVWQPRVKCRV